tara:strand:+ start:1356 stop:1727 length:372 start_codon:yes stop_codon:yes gene_type:complete
MFTKTIETFFPHLKKEETKMANSTQYVVYTREFKSRAKQIGVFAEPASSYKVNGEVHGGKIKFKNLAVKGTARKTATNKLLSKGIDFTVNVLGTAPKSSALTMKSNVISLLRKSGRKVINYSA